MTHSFGNSRSYGRRTQFVEKEWLMPLRHKSLLKRMDQVMLSHTLFVQRKKEFHTELNQVSLPVSDKEKDWGMQCNNLFYSCTQSHTWYIKVSTSIPGLIPLSLTFTFSLIRRMHNINPMLTTLEGNERKKGI